MSGLKKIHKSHFCFVSCWLFYLNTFAITLYIHHVCTQHFPTAVMQLCMHVKFCLWGLWCFWPRATSIPSVSLKLTDCTQTLLTCLSPLPPSFSVNPNQFHSHLLFNQIRAWPVELSIPPLKPSVFLPQLHGATRVAWRWCRPQDLPIEGLLLLGHKQTRPGFSLHMQSRVNNTRTSL